MERGQGSRSASSSRSKSEHDLQLFLSGPADGLDGLQRGARLLRRLAIRRRPTPAWTVITASVWATTSCSSRAMRTRLLADMLAGPFGLGGVLSLGLLGQSGHVPAARRNAVADEPGGHERQEAFHGLGGEAHADRERRIYEARRRWRRRSSDGRDRHPSRQPGGGEVGRDAEYDAERQRGGARGHGDRHRVQAAIATASTGTGQRRWAAIGAPATSAMTSARKRD